METSGGVSKSRLLSQAKNSTLEYDNLKIELEEWYYYFTFFFFHGNNSNILKLTKVTNKTNDKAIII